MTTDITPTLTARETFLRQRADEIRMRSKRAAQDIAEIGRTLTECKSELDHGEWLPWLEREFGWSERTAQRYMSVHKMLSSKTDTVSDLNIDARALFALASRAMPDTVRDEILTRARQGEHISHLRVMVTTQEAEPRTVVITEREAISHSTVIPYYPITDDSCSQCSITATVTSAMLQLSLHKTALRDLEAWENRYRSIETVCAKVKTAREELEQIVATMESKRSDLH